MRLSQAMRKGAAITPKAQGILNDGKGGTCALGAAMVGSGFDFDSGGGAGASAQKIKEKYMGCEDWGCPGAKSWWRR